MDKVTIVIPCYNYAHYLPQALDSALAQTYENKEVIVIDDCSTDNTQELMQTKYPNVRYIRHEVNQGLSATRNTGLKMFDGEWIMFLDSDDWIDKDLVQLSVDWGNSKGVDIVAVWQQEFGERADTHHFHPNPAFDDFMTGNKINCSSMFRRRVYEKIGGYDITLKSYEDWGFWLRATKAGFTVATIPLTLFHYRIHEDSMLGKVSAQNKKSEMLEAMKDSMPEIFA